MIIRKPYAFLIKNFKKIHIFLLLICGYIFYKNSGTRSFVSEFLNLGSYDSYNEPISKYINVIVIIFILIAIVLFTILAILLKRKNKPWKLYLIPVLEYTLMLMVFMWTTSYFNSYNGNGTTTTPRAIHDLLTITSIFEYPVILILLVRIFGVDLKKFNFQTDEEYLELSSEDREEFEINIDIDKESFKRGYKRFLRNVNYVYQEHKFIITSLITFILIIFISYSYYTVFILHKSYKQGDYFYINGYSIKINRSYYTDKDYKGKVISKNNNFVILDLNIKNNYAPRNINFNKFHIMNGINNYSYTFKTYETDFDDLGETYEKKELKRNEEINLIMIFKVDKKLNKNRFVLYYQDYIKEKPYLRKIKLNMEDVSKINKNKEIKIGQDLIIEEGNNKKDLNIEKVEISPSSTYTYNECNKEGDCNTIDNEIASNDQEKIMTVEFVSEVFEGKDLIDFSTKYGTINYIDNKGKSSNIKIEDAVGKKYMGQYMYIKIPNEVQNSSKISFIYIVRDKKYVINIK